MKQARVKLATTKSASAESKLLEITFITSGWTLAALTSQAVRSFKKPSIRCSSGTKTRPSATYTYLMFRSTASPITTSLSGRADGSLGDGHFKELVAPISVEFYSFEGVKIGDKHSMVQYIHDITGISIPALRGSPPSSLASTSEDHGQQTASRNVKRMQHTLCLELSTSTCRLYTERDGKRRLLDLRER